MMKFLTGLMLIFLLTGTAMATTNGEMMNYFAGYGLTYTAKSLGVSDRTSVLCATVLMVGEQLYKSVDSGYKDGFNVPELVYGMLGTFTALRVYDYSLQIGPRGLTVARRF